MTDFIKLYTCKTQYRKYIGQQGHLAKLNPTFGVCE